MSDSTKGNKKSNNNKPEKGNNKPEKGNNINNKPEKGNNKPEKGNNINNKPEKGNNKPDKGNNKTKITLKEYRELVDMGIIIPIEGDKMEKINKNDKDVFALLQVYGDEKKDSEFGALAIMDTRELKTVDDNLLGFCDGEPEFDSPHVGPNFDDLTDKQIKNFGFLFSIDPIIDSRNAQEGYYNDDPKSKTKILRGKTVKDYGSLLYVNAEGKPKCIERYRNKGFKKPRIKKRDLLLEELLKNRKGQLLTTKKKNSSYKKKIKKKKYNKSQQIKNNKLRKDWKNALKKLPKQDFSKFDKFCRIDLPNTICDQKCVNNGSQLPMCEGELKTKTYKNNNKFKYFEVIDNNRKGMCFNKDKDGIKKALTNRKKIYDKKYNQVGQYEECAFNEQCKSTMKCRKIPARCKLHKTRKVCI